MTGLEANTTYTFKVVTYDNAYNESGFSKTVEVTTHSRPDFQSGESYNMVALRGDGRVWTWGSAREGSLGDGTTKSRETPTQVKGLSQVISISSNNMSLIALQADGTAWSWGLNDQGQLGDGTNTNRLVPVKVLTAK